MATGRTEKKICALSKIKRSKKRGGGKIYQASLAFQISTQEKRMERITCAVKNG